MPVFSLLIYDYSLAILREKENSAKLATQTFPSVVSPNKNAFNPTKVFICLFPQQIQKNNQLLIMEENLFKPNFEEPLGALLHSSLWKNEKEQQPIPVQLYERAIKYEQKYLPFEFQLRFMIKDGFVHFFVQERQQKFELVQGDDEQWRQVLRAHLNQVAFHEHYRPIKKIGKGNFASVYLVENIRDGCQCAVKAFAKEAAYSEKKGKECLIKEIEIMRHLKNPHNMKLKEVFESDNSLYIVFELLDGGQLYEKIKSKEKFKPGQVRKIIQDLLEGLKEMHSKNIMHRDLKPQNILFRSKNSNDCVIADYGLAEFADSEQYLFMRCGTPGYVAPEVINLKDMKSKYQPVCDIFSLGLIFHILHFGKSIFKGKTYNDVLSENRLCSFNLNGHEYSNADPKVTDLLKSMLHINPAERITAEKALEHEYFTDWVKQSQDEIIESLDKVESLGESPILTTANEKRKQVKDLIRDSCLDFKMGKDNIIIGKTQTVETVGSVKLSGFGADLLKGFKASKFVKPIQTKENR